MERAIIDCYNVIVLLMRKGGAGKTTLILLLADALARFGLNVLVIDMDGQGNSSYGLGQEVRLVQVGTQRLGGRPVYEPEQLTVCEVIQSGEPGVIDEAITLVDWGYDPDATFDRGGPLFPGRIGQIGLVPCYKAFEAMPNDWATTRDLQRLASSLLLTAPDAEVSPHRRWDVVLIDTPPVGSKIHIQAAEAAFHALLIAPLKKFGAKAIPETVELIDDIRTDYAHDLNILGLIINDFVTQVRRTQNDILSDLEEGYENRESDPRFRAEHWPVKIPHLDVIADSHDKAAPVSAFLTVSASRQTARRVCQAAEANAVRLLAAIGHPRAAEVRAAWAEAWPENARAEFVTEA
jgi:chromosome partitioning protein